jgi:hypothetical protein
MSNTATPLTPPTAMPAAVQLTAASSSSWRQSSGCGLGGDQRTSLPLAPTLISRAPSGDHCSLRQAMQIHSAPPPLMRGAHISG